MATLPGQQRATESATPETDPTATSTPAAGAHTNPPGFPWGPVARLVLTLVLLAGALALLMIGQQWALALILLFGLRLLTETLLATQREGTPGRQAASLLSSATWAFLPITIRWLITHHPPFPLPAWLLGLSLLTGGLALIAHHERHNAREAGTGRILGTTGLLLAPLGAGLATTGALTEGGLRLAGPLAVSLASLLVLLLLRPRPGTGGPIAPTHVREWLRRHRLRLLLVLLPVVAYLATRDLLAEQDLVFPLWAWEFIAAVSFVSFLLWAARTQLRPLLTEDPLQSPHHRHEPSITRHSEPGFDEWESALGEFLRRGDKSGVNRLAQELERDDRVPATKAFSHVLGLRTRSYILLVHPGWLYIADLLTLLTVTLIVHHHAGRLDDFFPALAGPDHARLAAALTVSLGLYAIQANRHGGPWWIKTLSGYLGLLVLLFAWPLIAATLNTMGAAPSGTLLIPLFIVLAALPLVHAARARRHRPRYAYDGHDPAKALEQTIHTTKRLLIGRVVWTGGIGIAVIIATLALERIHPSYQLMLGVYALFTVPLVILPGVNLLGQRQGRRRIERITRHQSAHRQEHLEGALQLLEHAYAAQHETLRTTTHRPPRGAP